MRDALQNHVLAVLVRYRLQPEHTVVAGVSGGTDSLVLLHLLLALRAAGIGPRVAAVHVDHGIRAGSADEGRQVVAHARALGATACTVAVDVGAWDRAMHEGIEAAARAARYAALATAARDLGARLVVVGHTRDDQVETVLMHLVRGAGVDGLGGMREFSRRPVRLSPHSPGEIDLGILRPLLGVSRAQLTAYAQTHDLHPLEDPSNRSRVHRRNAVRLDVIPPLQAAFPGADAAVARSAALLRDDAALLAELAEDAAAEAVTALGGLAIVSRAALQERHPALQRRVLQLALARIGMAGPIAFERLEALREAALGAPVSTWLELGRGVAARVDYEVVAIGAAGELEAGLRCRSGLPLLRPGSVVAVDRALDVPLGNGWTVTCRPAPSSTAAWVLRTRRPGDRAVLDAGRSGRLQDWLVNRRVPSYLRDWLPLVEREGVVRWVGGQSPPECVIDGEMCVRLERADGGGPG